MSLLYQRFKNPEPNKTLLLGHHEVWKDPTKTVAPLESEKGVLLPTWSQFGVLTALTAVLTLYKQYRFK